MDQGIEVPGIDMDAFVNDIDGFEWKKAFRA